MARFYVAQYSSTVGTVINTKAVSNKAALIDFTANPGKFGAIVHQNNDGKFQIRYVAQAQFAEVVNFSQKTSEVGKLQYYMYDSPPICSQLFTYHIWATVLTPVIYSNQIQNLMNDKEWYSCKAAWYGDVTKQQKLNILELLKQRMHDLHYDYEGGGIETSLLMTMSHAQPTSIVQARSDWHQTILDLPVSYRVMIVDPAVSPVAFGQLAQQALPDEETTGVKRLGGADVGSIAAEKQLARKWLQDQELNGVVDGI